ncbi:MAG: peptidoglycan DD-metalloendopeptidase family protein [Candidatus Amulumruptor caecigallinarius]|nr:peptidoglycan DD-metalloendopeptidase family protein [Candidatus Amulumruptor caecigallinarius]
MALVSVGGATAQKITSRNPHSQAHKNLLASRAKNNDQIKLVEKNAFIDLIDDIEPEIDIYTEGWNSKRVNPFKESDVPNSKVIDVTGYYIPHKGKMTSNYGYRAKFGRMHKGVDIGIRSNDTIYAAFDGKVRLTNYEAKGYGNYVILRHPNGLETVYGHLNKFLVKPDQVVRAGQPIALGGSTGRSTGPHLHFETRYMGYAINPNAIFDFANKTTHTDTYTFSKSTYTQPRNFAPKQSLANADRQNTYKLASAVKSTYTVKRGDTLSSIARSYGMSTTTLRKLNDLSSSDRIEAGQVLKLK